MPTTATCPESLSLKGSRARDRCSCTASIPDCIWESSLQDRQDHTLCGSLRKPHSGSQVCSSCSSFISSTPSGTLSFTRAGSIPFAAFVCARHASHRLRSDFHFTNLRVFACQRKNLHCATWRCRASQDRPSLWHSHTLFAALIPFTGEPLLDCPQWNIAFNRG